MQPFLIELIIILSYSCTIFNLFKKNQNYILTYNQIDDNIHLVRKIIKMIILYQLKMIIFLT